MHPQHCDNNNKGPRKSVLYDSNLKVLIDSEKDWCTWMSIQQIYEKKIHQM